MGTEGARLERAELVRIAATHLGAVEAIDDLSWEHAESLVLELRTSTGERAIAKAFRERKKFQGELTYYETFVAALGSRAPELLGVDLEGQVLVLSKLNGRHAQDPDLRYSRVVHEDAGRALRLLHDALPPIVMDGFAEFQSQRVAGWIARCPQGLVGQREIEFAAAAAERLHDLPPPLGVACHRDWQPRNWLWDDAIGVQVIDFEHGRTGPWHEDLVRLIGDEWRGRPDLAEAFYDGYGQQMDTDELEVFGAVAAIAAFTTIVWAAEHEDTAFGEHGRARLAELIEERT